MVQKLGVLPRYARTLSDISVKEQQKVAFVAKFGTEDPATGVSPEWLVNLLTQQNNRVFGLPRTIYMDNGLNASAVDITCARTQFTTSFPAFGIGFIPVDALESDEITFYSEGTADCSVAIYNHDLPCAVWYKTDPLSPGFDVQAVLPEAASIQVLNNALVGGVAENVFPASASPGYKWARNLSNEVVYWRVGAAATGNFATDNMMNPGEGFNGNDFQLGFRTAQVISFFCASNANIQAMDWLVN